MEYVHNILRKNKKVFASAYPPKRLSDFDFTLESLFYRIRFIDSEIRNNKYRRGYGSLMFNIFF